MEFVTEGDTKLVAGWVFGKDEKAALGLYKKAIPIFVEKEEWNEAGNTWLKITNLVDSFEYPDMMNHAANAFSQSKNYDNYVNCLDKILAYWEKKQNYYNAAKVCRKIGDHLMNWENYEKAAGYFAKGSRFMKISGKDCNNFLEKEGECNIMNKNYKQARYLFAEMIPNMKSIKKYHIPKISIKLVLCEIMFNGVQSGEDLFHSLNLTKSKESDLLKEIIQAFKDHDMSGFRKALKEFAVEKLGKIMVTFLSEVKMSLGKN